MDMRRIMYRKIPGCDTSDDVRCLDLRSSIDRRSRGRLVPEEDQRRRGGPTRHSRRTVIWSGG